MKLRNRFAYGYFETTCSRRIWFAHIGFNGQRHLFKVDLFDVHRSRLLYVAYGDIFLI
jgi:hypothetical protein